MTQKKVLILFSYDVYPSGLRRYANHVDILQKHNRHPDVTYFQAALYDLHFVYDGTQLHITDPLSGMDLLEFDDVVFNKWVSLPQHAFAVATYLQANGRKFLSSEVVWQNPVTKLGEMPMLCAAGLPYPKTVLSSPTELKKLVSELPFGMPCIVKAIDASRGDNNFLVRNPGQFTEVLDAHPNQIFMVQEFLENDKDYRVGIMGGEIKYILERSREADKTHVNNTSQGGMAVNVNIADFPAELKDMALRAAAAVNRQDFCGVDILVDAAGNPYVLEVNKTPEIQTGFDIPGKTTLFTDYIYDRISQQ